MNDLLTNLLKLQAIDFAETSEKNTEAQKEELRARVPQSILGHYDRLAARGKKGVAMVRNQVCTGCHMRLPIGTINTLMQGQDIQLCDTCGRYLVLAEPAQESKPEEPTVITKPTRKPRKRKALTNAGV
jgi:predicted  nucleic acid-binding Zn-ribbon protein